MPNWCENRVTITGDNLEDVAKFLTEGSNPFSLNAIVPMPDILKRVVAPRRRDPETGRTILEPDNLPATPEEEAEIDAAGADDWHSWAIKNWGTKWNTDAEDTSTDHDLPHHLSYSFYTAWGPPEAAINALRERFPDCCITAFYNEPGMQFAGYL